MFLAIPGQKKASLGTLLVPVNHHTIPIRIPCRWGAGPEMWRFFKNVIIF
jgi:hypothetical protein